MPERGLSDFVGSLSSKLRSMSIETGAQIPPPQIRMRRQTLHDLMAMPEVPTGYNLRLAKHSDSATLASLMALAFEDSSWDAARVNRDLLDDPGCQTTFGVFFGETAVATATVLLQPEEHPNGGVLHWVASDPSHRGKSLGLIVSLAVLYEFQKLGCEYSLLLTDDTRLAAIKTYLKLGYEPDCWHESHQERWVKIRKALGM